MGNIINKILKKQQHSQYVNLDDIDCPICLLQLNKTDIIILNCGHRFHASCIFESLHNRISNCPMCRKQIKYKYPRRRRIQVYL